MRRIATLLIGLTVLLGCAGASRTTRVADIASGDYYTVDEVRGLTPEERDRYCAALDGEIMRLRSEAKVLDAAADSVAQLSDSLKAYNRQLATEIRDLDGEIRQLRLARRAATSYVVKKGDTLQKISSVIYGSSDRWRELYEANKDRIGSPDAPLRAGIRLTIPPK